MVVVVVMVVVMVALLLRRLLRLLLRLLRPPLRLLQRLLSRLPPLRDASPPPPLSLPFTLLPPSFSPFAAQLTERRRGNEAYRARDFALAYEHYSRADAIVETVEALSRADERELEACRLAVRLNLSALALARGEPREAETQASRALEIDPLCAKALLRRARARGTQGKAEDARSDLEAAARLDPVGAREAAEDIAREEARAHERQKTQLRGMFDRATKKKETKKAGTAASA